MGVASNLVAPPIEMSSPPLPTSSPPIFSAPCASRRSAAAGIALGLFLHEHGGGGGDGGGNDGAPTTSLLSRATRLLRPVVNPHHDRRILLGGSSDATNGFLRRFSSINERGKDSFGISSCSGLPNNSIGENFSNSSRNSSPQQDFRGNLRNSRILIVGTLFAGILDEEKSMRKELIQLISDEFLRSWE